ncbi:MAG: HAMP domain-containing protein [Thermoplasmata archaeon]|nr:HAMP domain-containing protein [Thermoplasmata archaeon]
MTLNLNTKISLKVKILIITVGVLFLYVSIGTLISSSIFADEYSKALISKSLVIDHSLKSQLDRLLKLGIPLEELTGFEKQCQEIAERYKEISYAMVVDYNGQILFHSDPMQQGRMINDAEILDAVRNEKENTQIFSMEEDYYGTSVPIFDTNGKHLGAVMVGFPVEIITQKTEVIIFSSIIVAFVSFIVTTVILVYTISRWITKPINKLLDVIKDIGEKGDLSRRVKIRSYDEIGQLASSFNQMIQDLEKTRGKLIEAQKDLEKKVKERTSELDEKVVELRESEIATLNILEDLQKTLEDLGQSKNKIEQQNIQLKKLNKIKSDCLNITSHELRTPMSSIKGYIQMMLKGNLGTINDEQKHALDIILRNSNRLNRLIQDILDISRLESGTMKFITRKTGVTKMIKEIAETMQTSADLKGIKINAETGIDVPELTIDIDRITQVVVNLLNNAIKFSPDGSTINIKTRKEKEDVLFEVQDYGRGIPEEHHKKIFQTFYQVDSDADTKFGGAGLGLAICYGIIIAHGGRIWVESTGKPGGGSTFRFTLPVDSVINIEERFKGADVFGLEKG